MGKVILVKNATKLFFFLKKSTILSLVSGCDETNAYY